MLKKIVSVFVPTFNGGKYLEELIESVLNQKLPAGYSLELLITDSGSKDSTLGILEKYQHKVLLNQIPNEQFGHGKTRQQAAERANGEFILFLSQDATPAGDRWLINIIEPFFISPKVGCVFGRQIPRPNAAVTIKREVATVFGGLGLPDSISLNRHKSMVDDRVVCPLNTFFSDVNSAVRRELLIGPIPFRDVRYAEDQALAEDILNHGYYKAYAPLAAVWHSNEYTPREYFHRKFDEYVGLQESAGYIQRPSLRSLLLGWARPTALDWKFLYRDSEYSAKSKIVWLLEAPFYNLANQAGKYYALKEFKNPAKHRQLSLEAKKKP